MGSSEAMMNVPRGVLVSFCNQPLAAPGLALLSIADGQLTLVGTGLPYTEAGVRQVTGLTSWLGNVYVAAALGRRFSIARLAPDLTVTDERYELRRVRAAHSLVATGPDEFHIVSSGTDEVFRVRIDPAAGMVVAEETVWEPGQPGAREDLHHLNGITRADGRLIVAGFGPRWREVREQRRQGTIAPYDGFLADFATGERVVTGLQMPHSPVVIGQDIAFCESAAEAVIVPGTGVADHLPGYTRGLCVVGDQILVGISPARKNHPGRLSHLSAVVMLDRNDLTTHGVLDLNEIGGEIYDLLPVDWAVPAPQPATATPSRLVLPAR